MRKTTSALRRELAAAEEADDTLANKLTALMSFLDATERSRMERDDARRQEAARGLNVSRDACVLTRSTADRRLQRWPRRHRS